MYGELIIDDIAAQVAEEFIESGVKVNNVNYRRCGVFIAASIGKAEVHKARLTRVVPTRIHRKGRTPGPSSEEIIRHLKAKAAEYGEGGTTSTPGKKEGTIQSKWAGLFQKQRLLK